MSENRIPTIDRLAERGLIDRWGFLTFAFVGAIAIIAAKAMGVTAIPVAAGAAILMALYAAIVQTAGTARLRSDQAGDNCYYLGLIFTLTSLSYAIFNFDPANTATTIVQGFGIALATTIMGLVLRVFFNQSRVDLVETEDSARLELAEAAGRLKAELASIVVSMNDFSRSTLQSLEELRQQIVEGMLGVQETAAQTITDNARKASEAITSQASEALADSKRVTAATTRIVNSVERHADSLSSLEKSSAGIMVSLAALEAAAAATQGSMGQLTGKASELSGVQNNMRQSGQELQQIVAELLGTVRSFDATANRFDHLIASRLEEVQAVPTQLINSASTAIDGLVNDIKRQLTALAENQSKAVESLSEQTSRSVAVVERHNAAFETELARSRDNVAKVHSALVSMTDELARQVEARSPE